MMSAIFTVQQKYRPPLSASVTISRIQSSQTRRPLFRRHSESGVNSFEAILLLHIWIGIFVDFFAKYFKRSNPEPIITVQSTVYNEWFFGFRVVRNAQNFVLITLEMTVYPWLYFISLHVFAFRILNNMARIQV